MIKAGLNIGNAKLSCIVCDFKKRKGGHRSREK